MQRNVREHLLLSYLVSLPHRFFTIPRTLSYLSTRDHQMVSKEMSDYLNEKSSLVITNLLPLSSQLICLDHNQWLQVVPNLL